MFYNLNLDDKSYQEIEADAILDRKSTRLNSSHE